MHCCLFTFTLGNASKVVWLALETFSSFLYLCFDLYRNPMFCSFTCSRQHFSTCVLWTKSHSLVLFTATLVHPMDCNFWLMSPFRNGSTGGGVVRRDGAVGQRRPRSVERPLLGPGAEFRMPDRSSQSFTLEIPRKKFTGRCRLFVGNLPNDLKDEELKKMFAEFGEINECYLSGKGFAFLRLVSCPSIVIIFLAFLRFQYSPVDLRNMGMLSKGWLFADYAYLIRTYIYNGIVMLVFAARDFIDTE